MLKLLLTKDEAQRVCVHTLCTSALVKANAMCSNFFYLENAFIFSKYLVKLITVHEGNAKFTDIAEAFQYV